MDPAEPHPDQQVIGEYEEGLLPPARAAEVSGHLAHCPGCAARLSAVSGVRRRLAALGQVPIPADVATRLDRAIGARAPRAPASPVRAATTVPPRRRSRIGVASLAAAAVLVLFVAGVVAGTLHFGGGGNSAAGGRAASSSPAAHQFVVTRSGRAYTKANLAAYVPAIVAAQGLPAHSAAVAGSAAVLSQPANPMSVLASHPAALRACLDVVSAPGPVLTPIGLDVGTFDGAPAAVFVLPAPGHPTLADVFVEGIGCAAGKDATLFYERVPRPPAP
jgi:anti-sigma factor RsiW